MDRSSPPHVRPHRRQSFALWIRRKQTNSHKLVVLILRHTSHWVCSTPMPACCARRNRNFASCREPTRTPTLPANSFVRCNRCGGKQTAPNHDSNIPTFSSTFV